MSRWTSATPFAKQCFVVTGAAVNMAGATMLLAYPSGMVLQLKRPDSEIPMDRSIESWIGATPAISGLLGSLLSATSMSCFGRRITQILSIISLIIGWLIIDLANGVTIILLGRVFQGIAMGSSLYITPILIGEYSSPKHRGAFMMITSLLSALSVLLVQATGLYLHWRTSAIICTAIASINLPAAFYSPESPSWLAANHRYEDCRRAFRWLRGDKEEEELDSMIKASELAHELELKNKKPNSKMPIIKNLLELKANLQTKAFYKPILIMIHVYCSGQWAGSNLFNIYVYDLVENIIGKGYKERVTDLNVNRALGAVLAIYIITKTKRRTMFLAFSGANAAVLLITAAYTYAKLNGVLPFDSPLIGLVLIHSHMFFVSTCTLPMPYIIAGEIFPLKYKSIAGGFSIIVVSLNTGLYVKSFPYLLSSIGIYGAYILYAGGMTYCLLIAYLYLPETKDRTLQEIEEEMTGKLLSLDELKSAQSLINKHENPETNKIVE